MLFFEILLGTALGIIFGLIPNFHINLLAYLLCAAGVFSIFPDSFYLFFSIAVSMTITGILPLLLFRTQTSDTFALFLGRASSSSVSEIKSQITLFLYGFIFGGIFAVLFLPLFYVLFVLFSDFYVLIFGVLFLILIHLIFQQESISGKVLAFLIILFSGTLGVLTLKYNFFFSGPLLPCIFGLFALPQLLMLYFKISGTDNRSKFVQEIVSLKMILYNSFLGTLFSSIIAIVPSISPGLSMGLSSLFKEKDNSTEKLILFSSTLISVILIYFFMAITFRKSRIGFVSILLEQGVIASFSIPDIFLLGFVFLLVIGATCLFLFYFSFPIISCISTFDHTKVNLSVILFSVGLIIAITNVWSVFLIILSCAIGFLPIVYNKNKLFLMSYLIVPTILFFI
ncbi:MAG: tripartite tricarboxylate transporter permease [archaeon]|jgi:TctA family transporter